MYLLCGSHSCSCTDQCLQKAAVEVQSTQMQYAGIGAQTALKLIQKHGNLSTVLENLDSAKYPLPEPFPYETAQGLFAGDFLLSPCIQRGL